MERVDNDGPVAIVSAEKESYYVAVSKDNASYRNMWQTIKANCTCHGIVECTRSVIINEHDALFT